MNKDQFATGEGQDFIKQAPDRLDENAEQSGEKGQEWPKAEFRFDLVGTLRKS